MNTANIVREDEAMPSDNEIILHDLQAVLTRAAKAGLLNKPSTWERAANIRVLGEKVADRHLLVLIDTHEPVREAKSKNGKWTIREFADVLAYKDDKGKNKGGISRLPLDPTLKLEVKLTQFVDESGVESLTAPAQDDAPEITDDLPF